MTASYVGKTALITGAARGIGLCIAQRLASEGAHVVIADLDLNLGRQAVANLHRLGLSGDFVAVDLSARGAGATMIAETLMLGRGLHVLVNNARARQRTSLFEETEESWDHANNVGLKAAFFAAQAAIRHFSTSGGGAIVNVASVAATLVTNESPAYHALKAGLVQLTKYLAVAAGPFQVRVNAVLPGLIVQEEHRPRFFGVGNEGYRETAEMYQPLGHVGAENDVAEAILYLASNRARYVSGACLIIDGGATVQDQFGLLQRHLAAL